MKKIPLILAAFFIYVSIFPANTDIRLNSVGYTQASVKIASVKAGSSAAFHVMSYPSGVTRLSGTTVLFGANTDTGETIYTADFSSVTAPGVYNIQVLGSGTSFTFQIGEDVYNDVFYTVFRGYYLWRCGASISETISGSTYVHTTCHANDGYLDYVGGGHVKKTGTGGWHDAGDYNKYVTNANVTVGVLGKAWEYLKPKIDGLSFGLPETAPGYPEYLKEIKWEIDWLFTMQAPGGRVYHKLSALNFSSDWCMPEYNAEDRFYVPYSTAATADFVAMMAQAYRLFLPYDAAYAGQCLAAARISYGRITTIPDNVNVPANQTGFSTGAYGTTDSDDRLWAAAEMWESTGEAVFKTDFENRADAEGGSVSYSMDWGDVKNLGMFTYYKSERPGKVSSLMNNIRSSTLSNADTYVNNMNNHGYARIFAGDYWWGVNGAVARASLTLYMANEMSPNADYVRAGYAILDHFFGRNYFCRSMVTGIGYNPAMNPHDRRSANDGIANPWPGYLVGGPKGNNSGDDVLALMAPDLPAALYWADHVDSYASNEIAINWNAGLVFALAWLKGAAFVPTPTITGTPPTATASPTITETHTITPTSTITQTHTITPTPTITPTEIFDTLEIKEHFTWPNPSRGAPIKFLISNVGFIETAKIRIFTFSDRKVGEVEKEGMGTSLRNEMEWNPSFKLGNGLYYYILEARGKNTALIRKQGAFVVLQQLQ